MKSPYSSRRRNTIIALLIGCSFFSLGFFKIINFYEDAAVDFRLQMRGPEKAHPDLTIVEIDDKSIQQIGAWPWPGKVHAALLEILQKYRPSMILYDVLFADASRSTSEYSDLSLSMEKYANVLLPFLYLGSTEDPFFPAKDLIDSARAVGFIRPQSDPDGHVRKITVSVDYKGTVYYHHAILPLLAKFRDEEESRKWLAGLPLTPAGELYINFPGPVDSFQRIPFHEVLSTAATEKEADLRRLFQGKIILIGLTATGSHALQPAAFSPMFPAVAMHASVISSLLTGKLLRLTPPWINFLVITGLCLFSSFVIGRFGPSKAAAFVLFSIALYMALNYGLFLYGIVLPLTTPLFAMFFCYLWLFFESDMNMHFRGRLIERELNMAAEIQESFLPRTVPAIPGIDIAYECRFAKKVGGDFYDWMDLGEGRIGIAVGDVSGKGVPAALYMARALSEFRRDNQSGRDPGQVIHALNDQLAVRTYAGMFLTITYVIIDQPEKKLYLCSAGHEPGLLYQRETNTAVELKFKKGPPVGAFTDSRYITVQRGYSEGDALLLISDGVTELRNQKGTALGLPKLCELFQKMALDDSAAQITKGLFHHMDLHSNGSIPHDDRTILCVKFGSRF